MNVICLKYCNEVDTDEEFIFNEVIQNQNQQAVDMELHCERVTVDGPITEHGCLLVSEKLATNSSHLSESGCNEIKLTDSLPVTGTTQDTIGLNGFKKDIALNVELDTGCSNFIKVEDASLSCSRTSSARQTANVDTLEDFVNQTEIGKEKLVEAMELNRSLRTEADGEEVAAQRSEEDAANSGLDILSKVEQSRNMLARPTEINDMPAGEVYGERAVLATETLVLRSCLAKLSVDKDKAFCMINQMREKLQARVDIAKREREAAEKEKMRKEENARKLLSVEEALMAKVARNSRELEKEAEKNTKVREFLIDRGRTVDAMQGKVSVLFEDLKLLKEQMDGGITKGANRYLNINLVAPPKCRGMNGPRTSSKDDILGPFSSRAHSSNVDISMSMLCTRSDSHDSQDAQSLHSSVCQSFANVTSVVASASSTRLAEFDPYTGFPSTHNNDAELCCPTTEVERPMAETDTKCHGLSPKSSNYSVETEEQQ